MDPPGLLSLCTSIKRVFIIVYLLGSATRCLETEPKCECTDIPPWSQTQPATPGCFQIDSTYRYKCIDGYVRRAGTSSLIRCVKNNQWSKVSLECIVNPLWTTTTPKTTSTTFPTSTVTPSLEVSSSVRSETEHPEPTSAFLPPQHTSDTPTTSQVSSSAPFTPERFHSTSSLSSPTTTHKSRRLDRTTSPSRSFLNSTSSTQQETAAVATKVIVPVAVGIIVLAVGAIWFVYRRKLRKSFQQNHNERPTSEEETVPMQEKGVKT